MNKYSDVNGMTGAGSRKPSDLKYNKVSFNGKTGVFEKMFLLEPKNEAGKYREVVLGRRLEVVFLKHRRVLSQFIKGKPSPTTNEHNVPGDYVTLFNVDGVDKAKEYGKASDLRAKYDKLRTNQIVYAYIPELKEVVKLTIKGASLGSESKAKEVLSYYDYLSSFDSKNDEHSWQFITILEPVEESSDMGSYYCINFIRGAKLEEAQMDKVAGMIREIHSKIQEADEYNLSKIPASVIKSDDEIEAERVVKYRKDVQEQMEKNKMKPQEPVIEYPTEEINPEDIPF